MTPKTPAAIEAELPPSVDSIMAFADRYAEAAQRGEPARAIADACASLRAAIAAHVARAPAGEVAGLSDDDFDRLQEKFDCYGHVDAPRLRDFADAVFALASQASTPVGEVAGWQPIETAPKTGRTLLLGYFNVRGKWRTLRGEWFSREVIDEQWENAEDCEEGWYETMVEGDEERVWKTEPTHWMPLPAAPGAASPAPAGDAQHLATSDPEGHRQAIADAEADRAAPAGGQAQGAVVPARFKPYGQDPEDDTWAGDDMMGASS